MKPSVCLILEGSYPFITGGVSAWVHQLLLDLSDIDFLLYTISPAANQEARYELPANVVGHTDLVLGSPASSRRRPRGRRTLLREIRKVHEQLFLDSTPSMEQVIKGIPSGYNPYVDAVRSDIGWSMLASANRRHNPVYPFSDYFWAWKSAHDMMFAVLGHPVPQADLYHAVSTGYAGLAGVAATVRTGRPLLLTEHGLYHKEREMEIRKTRFIRGYQRDMWIRTYNSLSRLCYRYASLIVSLFEVNRQKQLELGAPAERTRVIPNGIDVAYYSAVRREKRPGFHVGLVGRVVPIKDIKTFIAMARIVSERLPEARFHCIGPTDEDPTYFEECVILVRSYGLEEKFDFAGRQDVRRYYSFLDVLLLTSVREAQPLVILEGYCAGVPAVATRVGNVPELLDYDERFLAAPKDPEKLAQGVLYVRDHPREMESLVAQNRERVFRFYDRTAVFRTYRELYLEQAAGSAGNRGG